MISKKIFFYLFLGIFIGVSLGYLYPHFQSFETKRTNIVTNVYELINQQKEKGNYDCCMEPPCTQCFMGEWIWDNGVCKCDEMIAQGEYDKVCPECKNDHSLEEGKCKYSQKDKYGL